MPTVFEKLNLKGQDEIVVLDAPDSFGRELAGLAGVRIVRKLAAAKEVSFALAFVTRQADLDRLSEQLVKKATDDALLWIVYPKGSSKRYTCEFNRDTGFATLRHLGFDSVRQVAIDEDWSALRFRRNEHIKAK
jgi:hypothetical protein